MATREGLPPGYDAWRTSPPPEAPEPPAYMRERVEECATLRGEIRALLTPAMEGGLIAKLRRLEELVGCTPKVPRGSGEHERMVHGSVEDLDLETLEALARDEEASCQDADLDTFISMEEPNV